MKLSLRLALHSLCHSMIMESAPSQTPSSKLRDCRCFNGCFLIQISSTILFARRWIIGIRRGCCPPSKDRRWTGWGSVGARNTGILSSCPVAWAVGTLASWSRVTTTRVTASPVLGTRMPRQELVFINRFILWDLWMGFVSPWTIAADRDRK